MKVNKNYTYLTSYLDRNNGIVHVFDVDEKGEVIHSEFPFIPYIFIYPDKNIKTKFKDLNNNPVIKKEFTSFKHYNSFIKTMKERNKPFFENNFSPPELQFIVERYLDIDIKERKINLPKIQFFDIECDSSNGFPDIDRAENEITCITIYDFKLKKYFLFSMKKFNKDEIKNILNKNNVQIDESINEILQETESFYFKTEEELLINFFKLLEGGWIYSGWNIENFDIPYLYNRSKRLGNKVFKYYKHLSPINSVYLSKNEYSRKVSGKTYYRCGINGKIILDYMVLFKKFSYMNLSSYKLDFVGQEVLNLGKIKVTKGKRNYTLTELWDELPDLYMLYNIRDVEILKKLEDKYKFFNFMLSISFMSNIPLNKVINVSNVIDGSLLYYLRKRNKVAPPMRVKDPFTYPGAYVKDSLVGIYEWLVDFDLTSSYPSHQIVGNISPETYIGRLRLNNEQLKLIENEM